MAVGDWSIGNRTGYCTIDQFWYPLAEIMNCSKKRVTIAENDFDWLLL